MFIYITIDLRLPDCVGDSPEPGHDEEDVFFVRIRNPKKHPDDQAHVDGGSEKKYWHPSSNDLNNIKKVETSKG